MTKNPLCYRCALQRAHRASAYCEWCGPLVRKEAGVCNCDFGTGSSVCHCTRCHRTFVGPNSFTRHQTIDEGKATCIAPESRPSSFAVKRKTGEGEPIWGSADVFDKQSLAKIRG